MKRKKLLVTCPIYDGNEKYLQGWIDTAKSITIEHDTLLADNSVSDLFFSVHSPSVAMLRVDIDEPLVYRRITQSMARIRDVFLDNEYEYWMNIEIDVRPAAGVVEALVKIADENNADIVSHSYSERLKGRTPIMEGVGCALFSRNLIENFCWGSEDHDPAPDTELGRWLFLPENFWKYRIIRLSNMFKVDHVKNEH